MQDVMNGEKQIIDIRNVFIKNIVPSVVSVKHIIYKTGSACLT